MRIFFVGLGGVPYSKRAGDIRLRFLADALVSGGHEVSVLNRLPFPKTDESLGKFTKVIELFPHETRLTLWIRFCAFFREICAVFTENRQKKIDVLHVYTGHFIDFLFYFVLSRAIGAKVIYSYVEFRSRISRQNLYHRLNGYLVDRWGMRFVDGMIPISFFLAKHAARYRKSLPMCKIPPICDFEQFSDVHSKTGPTKGEYILFCGSAEYREVIDLIKNAYDESPKLKERAKLKLVLGGRLSARETLRREYPSEIEILSGLPYEELLTEFRGALALLIPMRDTIQDLARFPNKICEYVATRGLILTTKYGEIPFFFEDGKTALIAEDFSVEALRLKMEELALMSQGECDAIRERCYEMGKRSFDFKAYVEPLNQLLHEVVAPSK